jgi:hypothetical protein
MKEKIDQDEENGKGLAKHHENQKSSMAILSPER